MYGQNIHRVEPILLLLLVCIIALALLAKRFKTPYPIVLVIAGLFLSLMPHMPQIGLNPDVIFLLFLPPLLFSAAVQTSWRDFRYNLVSISMLALGLVSFTVYGVAFASKWILPGFNWHMGIVLGAVVCTTDAIAATAIAERLGIPKQLTDIIEGESLVNDASGLLALQIAIAIVMTGHAPPLAERMSRLFYLVFTGIAVGLVIAKLVYWIEKKINDAPIEITITIITPYFAYLVAEGLHSSGVIATVACGIYLGHTTSIYLSTRARLQAAAVWETLTFVLNGIVFILIGLQLPHVLADIRSQGIARLFMSGLLFSGVVILLRLVWVYPGAWASNWIRRRLLQQPESLPNPRYVFVLGWTGMRGVVALAAAISLPVALADGTPFTQRNMIIFLTFCVIFVTLVLQGLTLPFIIRRLGLAGIDTKNPEEEHARYAMIEAALAYLEEARESDLPEFKPVYDDLIRVQNHHLNLLPGDRVANTGYRPQDYERFREISQRIRALERAALLNLYNHNKINDAVLRRLEQELDLFDVRFANSD
jgi:monovalent cation/hydrogen antiporter